MSISLIADYSQWQSLRGTIGDNNVLDRLDCNTILLPTFGDTYLQTVTLGIFTANRFYTAMDEINGIQEWCEYDPVNDIGITFNIQSGPTLYQINEQNLLVEIDVISSTPAIQSIVQATLPQAILAGVVDQLVGYANEVNLQVGTMAAATNNFVPAATGIYSIQCSVTAIAGANVRVMIEDNTSGGVLAVARGIDIGYGAGCTFCGSLDPLADIRFYARTDLGGNISSAITISRIA